MTEARGVRPCGWIGLFGGGSVAVLVLWLIPGHEPVAIWAYAAWTGEMVGFLAGSAAGAVVAIAREAERRGA